MQDTYVSCRNFTLNYSQNQSKNIYVNATAMSLEKQSKWQLGPINLDIRKGEKIAILGKSGSGKTTLLKALQKENYHSLEFKVQGSIELSRLKCVSVFQEPKAVLNPLKTVFALFRDLFYSTKFPYAKAFSRDQIISLLEEFELYDENILKKHAGELSGGMSQRIMIAMACSLLPDIILADEISASLDLQNEKIILDFIKSRVDTLCFVTHRLYLIEELCDRIIFLKNGRILFDGNKDEFLSTSIPELQSYIHNLSWAN